MIHVISRILHKRAYKEHTCRKCWGSIERMQPYCMVKVLDTEQPGRPWRVPFHLSCWYETLRSKDWADIKIANFERTDEEAIHENLEHGTSEEKPA